MKYRKTFITGLILLMSINMSTLLSSQNVKADDIKVVRKLKPNSNYPDIKAKFDTSNMHQYSDNDLADPTVSNVTLKKFYVKYVSYDQDKSTNLLLTPGKKSDQYFFSHIDSKVKTRIGNKVTIQGNLLGNSKTSHGSNGYGYITKRYVNKPDTLINTSKISIIK